MANTKRLQFRTRLRQASGVVNIERTALELSLIALAQCAVTILADVAKNSKIPPSKTEAHLEAEKPSDSPRLEMNLECALLVRQEKTCWRQHGTGPRLAASEGNPREPHSCKRCCGNSSRIAWKA
jgi:hypothetical protein